MTTTSKVVVLVLHWKGVDKTRDCIRSLETLTYANFSVLLVDNGSSDNDGQALKREFDEGGSKTDGKKLDLQVLRLDRNYGFAGGCNKGMEHILQGNMGEKAAYIWLLNNDALTKPETLTRLIDTLKDNDKAGAAAALVVEGGANNQARVATGHGRIDFAKAKTYLKPLPDTGSQANSAGSCAIACDWVTGSNLLLKTSVLEQCGTFDERFFLYFEDVDLCHRLNKAGYQCLLVLDTVIDHEGSGSTQGGLSLWRAYYHTRNRLLFFSKNSPPALRGLALATITSHVLKHCLTLPWRGSAGRAKLKAELLGLRDFYAGDFGEAKCLDWCESLSFQ
jgi:Predicted glycosyltransferases